MLYSHEVGEGPPAVMIHGLAASSLAYGPIIDRGLDRFRFLTVDLPSSGRSGAYCAFDPTAIAEQIAALLEKKHIEQALLVGHSYGGVVSLELLRLCPERFRALLVLSAPALGLGGLRPLLRAEALRRLDPLLERLQPTRAMARAYIRLVWGDHAVLTEERLRQYEASMQGQRFMGTVLEALRSLDRYQLDVAVARSVAIPKAVLWGDRDRLVSVLDGERLARALDAPFTVLHGAGHFLPEERPAEILEAMGSLHALAQRRWRSWMLTKDGRVR